MSQVVIRFPRNFLLIALLLVCPVLESHAQDVPASEVAGLKWRLIGPFRGGRVVAVSGKPGSSTDFYFGAVGGGIWKTTDAGTVWKPTFDKQGVASVGALTVSVSDPNVIYAGTGESDIRSDLATGDGVYKSTDGGETWTNIGLRDSRQISRILVDPKDPNVVYVGVLGHAYGPNEERGVYKSTDGGATWKRVLDKGSIVGIADIAMATDRPNILFAATWNAHRPPWSTYAPLEGPGNGLYRSTDAGATWSQLSSHGLPAGDWGRTGVAVSSDGKRVYASIDDKKQSGLYRSDDGGDNWQLVNSDSRLTSRAWYFNSLTIDPQKPDVLYIPNIALYRTEDGGKTISIVRGAPGGDDYHQVWVDPQNSAHLVLGVDQGATISLDYGKTWTTWYNQPTAQLYHVATDHQFPYVVYGAQQDSGAIAVSSRTDHGQITARDWFQPGGSESGYIAVDPKDESIIYLSGAYGDVQRFDRTTSFSQNVTPWPASVFGTEITKRKYRAPWTPVLAFSAADKTSLYLGTQFVLKTTDGGLHWQQISPDLTGAVNDSIADGPGTTENAAQRGYGVVYSIAPSPLDAKEIWVGSDTGLIHLTIDGGKSWANVTPNGLSSWSKIAMIEASHFDRAVAYAVVDRHRLDDRTPYLYITRDFGKTWRPFVDGFAKDAFLNCLREDPKRRGLLYAGTESGVFVSFNDGSHWQPLQLNLPVSSIRDLDVHEEDLVVATHGRSFWILDDISPLRQVADARAASGPWLYRPSPAIRIDNDGFLGTPLPPEEPTAENPPSGAILDYTLKGAAHKASLEIYDSRHVMVRHFSSGDQRPATHPLLPIAERWFPAPPTLSTEAGAHRFVWDLASGESGADSDSDLDENGAPPGPRVPPGDYTVKLIADQQTLTETLHVAMDPRVKVSTADLMQQYGLAHRIHLETLHSRKALAEAQSALKEIQAVNVEDVKKPDLASHIQQVIADIEKILESDKTDGLGLVEANGQLASSLRVVESGHRAAPAQAIELFEGARKAALDRESEWAKLKSTEMPTLNLELRNAGLQAIQISAIEEQVEYLMTR
jgi:photosystem II stability/assembly factor-like uncharacterized protein